MTPRNLVLVTVALVVVATLVVFAVQWHTDYMYASPTHSVAQQFLVASWFGVSPDAVQYHQARGPIDTEVWRVTVPYSDYPREVHTRQGTPVYIDDIPVPDETEVAERWQGEASFSESLPPSEREAAEIAGFAIAKMLNLPTLSDEYLEVAEIRPLGDDPKAATTYWIVLRMKQQPWLQLNNITMNIYIPERQAHSVSFGGPTQPAPMVPEPASWE